MTLLPNFAPWMALAYTGTLVFPRGTIPWWAWPVILMGIDFTAMGAQMWSLADGRAEVFLTYGLYAGAAYWASQMRGRFNIVQTLLGVIACGTIFYLVTNALCWWVKPYYTKDLAGFVQAMTTGLPSFAPTWTFFRNSLLSDLGFSVLLLAAYNLEAKVRSVPVIRWVSTPA